ncbi:molybdenum cofactor guanylyltransferase [bacterium SCSIO 12643]|nr:molybdenum cofactor guanylyltransferase [bacterium SCSIO 12643]
MIQDVSIVILAGGKSSRMGEDKGLLNMHGRSFIDQLMHTLKSVSSQIWISVAKHNRVNYKKYASQLVIDEYVDLGPLGGITSVLDHIQTDWFYVISVDAPLVTEEVLKMLWNTKEGYEAVVFETEGKIHPLIALYHKSTKQTWRLALNENRLKITELVYQMKYKTVVANAEQTKQLRNINTPKDYKEVLRS